MATVQLPISAEQAQKEATAYMRKQNGGRYVPPILPVLQKLAKETRVYIFNVSPMSFTRHMGSTGTFIIPAKEEGKDYSAPLAIDGVVFEPIPALGNTMKHQEDEGMYVAQQICGVGAHLPPNDSLLRFGVFISETNPPKPKAVQEAREQFHKYCAILVKEASDAFAMGPQKFNEMQTSYHYMAAHVLGFDAKQLAWLGSTAKPEERNRCTGCGTSYVVGTIKCHACGYILDIEAHKKAKAEGRYA